MYAANTHDTVTGCSVFEEVLMNYPTLKGVCTDADYRKTMEEFVEKSLKKTIQISACITPGCSILSKRWIAESTLLGSC